MAILIQIAQILLKMKNHKTLKLNVRHKWFEVMVTGEKTFEFRKASKWMISRLKGRKYDFVEIRSGYGKKRPYFIAKCVYIKKKTLEPVRIIYSNDLFVDIDPGDIIIKLGKIIKIRNYEI